MPTRMRNRANRHRGHLTLVWPRSSDDDEPTDDAKAATEPEPPKPAEPAGPLKWWQIPFDER